jgi:hypothetical protein
MFYKMFVSCGFVELLICAVWFRVFFYCSYYLTGTNNWLSRLKEGTGRINNWTQYQIL